MRPPRVAGEDIAEGAISLITSVQVLCSWMISLARLRSLRSPFTCLRQRGCPWTIGSVPGLRVSALVQ
eukprot:2999813-Prymnesium_polylepis.1